MTANWRRCRGALFAMGLAALGLASCRQVAGISDHEPPPACVKTAEALSSGTCGDCLVERCCSELDACSEDAACRALLTCSTACADDTCRAACEKGRMSEASAAVSACRAARCETPCGLTCGGEGSPFTGCKDCARACCPDARAFRGDLDGQRLRACRAACNAPHAACVADCTNTHIRGADLERIASECLARACSIPGAWGCAGNVDPVTPPVAPKFLQVDVTLFNAQTSLPIRDATVRGCSAEDLACVPAPFGTATTDAQGNVSLKVRLDPAVGFKGYSGFLEITREGYVPTLLYFSPALVTDVRTLVLLYTTARFQQITSPSGVALAADRGTLAATLSDCRGAPATGLSVRVDTADAAARTFYLRSGSSGGGSFDFTASATTDEGVGGVFNLPAGRATVAANHPSLCYELATATIGIRPGAVSAIVLAPQR